MDRARKVKKLKNTVPCQPEQPPRKNDTFTAEMRFIVTRNKRKTWDDEMHDIAPNNYDPPVFN